MSSSALPKTMRAAVSYSPVPPDSFPVEDIPISEVKMGQSLIKIMASGMSRSEKYTRQVNNTEERNVASTSRHRSSRDLIISNGADGFILDNSRISLTHSGRFTKILELVGAAILRDSILLWGETIWKIPLEKIVKDGEEGRFKVKVGKVLGLEEVGKAHKVMEEGKAGGKMVLVKHH
ncbi:hypothetical protein M231_01230 [Tremella mesenterica]|uniref:Uncharacterized protein n=1 Tax=Tremella mesenterica TaxID=5217 RepID=A0A4Q1BU74_TREME|nr:hypothetical protein M231_01230 [Tremella mesenterica]